MEFKEIFNIPYHDLITTSTCNLRCDYCFVDKYNAAMSHDEIKEFYTQKSCVNSNFFGGEPLLNIPLLLQVYEIESKKKNPKRRDIITNGTLIPQSIEKLKPYIEKNLVGFQVSLDGPEHVTNMNRKYCDGKGAFEDIMKGIKVCIENKIQWSVHGVTAKNTLPYFAESLIFLFELLITDTRLYPISRAIEMCKKNVTQIVMEDDYTDADVDILLRQIDILELRIMQLKYLSNDQKVQLLKNFLMNKAKVCAGGTKLMTVSPSFNLFTCHRFNELDKNGKFHIGTVNSVDIKNINILNSYNNIWRYGKAYSTVLNVNKGFSDDENIYWLYWCPATFYQTTKSIYKIPSRYNVMMYELNRKINEVLKKYGVTG